MASSLEELLEQVEMQQRKLFHSGRRQNVSSLIVLRVLWFCVSGGEGVHVVLSVPDPGPGGGRD